MNSNPRENEPIPVLPQQAAPKQPAARPAEPTDTESEDPRLKDELKDTKHKHPRRRRFWRGYLMTVGALTTLYVLVRLVILLLVEIAKWTPVG